MRTLALCSLALMSGCSNEDVLYPIGLALEPTSFDLQGEVTYADGFEEFTVPVSGSVSTSYTSENCSVFPNCAHVETLRLSILEESLGSWSVIQRHYYDEDWNYLGFTSSDGDECSSLGTGKLLPDYAKIGDSGEFAPVSCKSGEAATTSFWELKGSSFGNAELRSHSQFADGSSTLETVLIDEDARILGYRAVFSGEDEGMSFYYNISSD